MLILELFQNRSQRPRMMPVEMCKIVRFIDLTKKLSEDPRLNLSTKESLALMLGQYMGVVSREYLLDVIGHPISVRQKQPLVQYSRHDKMNGECPKDIMKMWDHNWAVTKLCDQPTECMELIEWWG